MNHKKSKGFTLIELLVVIAIIGILATIVLVSLNSARLKARDSRRVSDIRQIQLALELYADGVGAGNYPGAGDDPYIVLKTNGYMSNVPLDPVLSEGRYFYVYCTTGNSTLKYHLGANLEEVGSAMLNSDSDFNSSAPSTCGVTYTGGYDAATPPNSITGFDGADDGFGCEGTVGNRNCYDIAN